MASVSSRRSSGASNNLRRDMLRQNPWLHRPVRLAAHQTRDPFIGTVIDTTRDSAGAIDKCYVEWPHFGPLWHFSHELVRVRFAPQQPSTIQSEGKSRPESPYVVFSHHGSLCIWSNDGWKLATAPTEKDFDGALEEPDIRTYLNELAAAPELIEACRLVLRRLGGDISYPPACLDTCRQALAKAWGCTPEEVNNLL